MNSDVRFDFEHAAWPALLVDGAGGIVRANPMALTLFGSGPAGGPAPLAALWYPDNCIAAEKFLKDGETALAPLTPIKLLVAGKPKVFSALVAAHPQDGKRHLLLQLLPESV